MSTARRPSPGSPTCAAFSLIEMLISVVLLCFVVGGTALLFSAGYRQQQQGFHDSEVQSELSAALRTMLRVVRHGRTIVARSLQARFPATARTSNARQIIVQVPEPAGAHNDTVEIRLHVSDGTLYAQRADEAPPGRALMTGVTAMAITYYRTVAGERVTADRAPGSATEVQILLRAQIAGVARSTNGYAVLRNRLVALYHPEATE
ncbi:MAG: hypothetical protein RMJ43_03125 [Chloroherpetonaceae bacterium]|nr:hypothetical protein [Chthonomonadaceae bacterium]MDW8206802.1 hypothetical protein [Chloroherpetonaceae bacterium]